MKLFRVSHASPFFWQFWQSVGGLGAECGYSKQRTRSVSIPSYRGVRTVEDIAPTIELLKGVADALYVCADPFLTIQRARVNAAALSARLPVMQLQRFATEAGGLISYGPDIPDMWRRAIDLVDKILRGTKPADIPVEQPTKFDLVVNLKTAKALGLKIPETFLTRADEVIE